MMAENDNQTSDEIAPHLYAKPVSTKRLTINHMKIMALSSLGTTLEFYEFVIFILLSPYLSQVFFPASTPSWMREFETLAIFSIGYFTRPIGGVLLAAIGDSKGRRVVFAVSLLLMALPTLMIGFLPTFAKVGILAPLLLLLCRLLQGLALGGELPTAMVFMSEHVPERRLGFAFGVVGIGAVLGFMVAAFVLGNVHHFVSKADFVTYGWRIPFVIGGAFGLIASFLRRYVGETPIFQDMRKRQAFSSGNHLANLLKFYKKEVFFALLLSAVPGVMVTGVQIFPVIWLQTAKGYHPSLVHECLLNLQICLIIGAIVGGIIVDIINWAKAIIITLVLLIISIFSFYLYVSPDTLWIFFSLIGLFLSALIMMYNPLVHSFPAQLRLTGISFVYNVSAAIFGGTTPMILEFISHYSVIGLAIYPCIFGLIGIFATIFLWKYRKPLAEIV